MPVAVLLELSYSFAGVGVAKRGKESSGAGTAREICVVQENFVSPKMSFSRMSLASYDSGTK